MKPGQLVSRLDTISDKKSTLILLRDPADLYGEWSPSHRTGSLKYSDLGVIVACGEGDWVLVSSPDGLGWTTSEFKVHI